MNVLSPTNSLLLIIDIQEKLFVAMNKKNRLMLNATRLAKGAVTLGVPIIITEQYPKGLGFTLKEIIDAADKFQRHEKLSFGCLGETTIEEKLSESGKKQIIVCGIETHVCVHQTVIQLLAADYQVFLAADACSSRNKVDHNLAIKSMENMGCRIGSCEMLLFELMRTSAHPCFKSVSAIIK